MKKIWMKLKGKWKLYWEDDEDREDRKHLSQHDIRTLLYGGFMISVCTLTICIFVIAFCNIRVSHQNKRDTEEILSMIATYMATATEDEYDDIVQNIRHDLVFSKYGQEIEDFLRYIPNTSVSCCLERDTYLERIFLVCPNNGELYGLDIYEMGDTSERGQKGDSMRFSFGYDEISETSLHIKKRLTEGTGTATVCRKRGIVSAQKMKSFFCDECIREIVNTTAGGIVNEVVICDIEKKKFYPVEEGSLKIGDYKLEIVYEDGNYVIETEYI